MERHAEAAAKILQVGSVSLIVYVFHPYVYGLDLEQWALYAHPSCKQFEQAKGVLPARQRHEDLVVVLDEAVGGKGFVKPFQYSLFKFVLFGVCHHCSLTS